MWRQPRRAVVRTTARLRNFATRQASCCLISRYKATPVFGAQEHGPTLRAPAAAGTRGRGLDPCHCSGESGGANQRFAELEVSPGPPRPGPGNRSGATELSSEKSVCAHAVVQLFKAWIWS